MGSQKEKKEVECRNNEINRKGRNERVRDREKRKE